MKRATLRFNSDSGGEYLYDDVTGNIFPWDSMEDAILNRELGISLTYSEEKLLQSTPNAEIAAKINYIRRWRNQYHAFARPSHSDLPVPTADQTKILVQNNCITLVLVVTENCNLKCRYCCYASESYTYHRKPTNRTMSYDQAIKAIVWFLDCMSPQMSRNPRKTFGLTFYGGEPLLNIKLIKKVLEYVKNNHPGLFFPVLTTNGVLLTPENVKILVDHNVHLSISIDGPEDEHNRLRVDLREQGTYKRIIENLSHIRGKYPEYWTQNLLSVSVYDPRSDIIKTSQFFDENNDLIPRSGFVNLVQNRNTEYYNQFKKEDYDLFFERLHSLRKKYKKMKISGEKVGSYLATIAGSPLIHIMLRTRVGDYKNPFIPYTGCCVPGFRLTVGVDGKIDMCERVNGTFPIGHLDQGGLNYDRIAQLIQQYQQNILKKCARCPITRLCSLCFATSETNGGVDAPRDFCENNIKDVLWNLADYVSMMEANNKLEFELKSDFLAIQRNSLFYH